MRNITPLFKESLSVSSWQEAVKCCGLWEKNPGPQALSWNNQNNERAGAGSNPDRIQEEAESDSLNKGVTLHIFNKRPHKCAQDVETCNLLRVLDAGRHEVT